MNELVVLRPHLTAMVIFADVEMLMIITISPENPFPFPFIGPHHWYAVAKRVSTSLQQKLLDLTNPALVKIANCNRTPARRDKGIYRELEFIFLRPAKIY